MIKGIIFDLDGTTMSTLEDIKDSVNMALRVFNLPERTIDEIRMAVGNGTKNLIRRSITSNLDEVTLETIENNYRDTYSRNYNNKTKPYEGIRETLLELQNRNIQLAIHSNKPDAQTKNLIKENLADINFVCVYGERKGVPLKPDPAAVEEIIEKMKLNKEEVIYVGDSETDVLTAKNTGIKVIGCLWGFRDEETLKRQGADYIASKPADILNII